MENIVQDVDSARGADGSRTAHLRENRAGNGGADEASMERSNAVPSLTSAATGAALGAAPAAEAETPNRASTPTRDSAGSARRAGAKPSAEVTRRVYTRNGRYYLDLRDLGRGRVALKPAGASYATKDELVAIDLASALLREVLVPERARHFVSRITRVATVGAFSREWLEFARGRAASGEADAGAGGEDVDNSNEGFASLVTLKRYEQALTQLFRSKALDQDLPMHAVEVRDAKHAIKQLRATVTRSGKRTSASSIHQIITAMQLIFDHAADEGAVLPGHNPWRELKKQDRPSLPRQSRTDFLEIYEAHAFIEACYAAEQSGVVDLPLGELAETFLYTGGRKAEVLGLDVRDIDFRTKTIRFAKNRWRMIKDYDERSVPMHPALERTLRRYLAANPRISGLVFPGRSRTGAEQMITSYFKAFERARKIAVVTLGDVDGAAFTAKSLNPRVFRVTYCSARLQTTDNGKPIALITVEAELGHNSAKMIKRVYGRVGRVRARGEHVEYVSRAELERGGSPSAGNLETTHRRYRHFPDDTTRAER